MSAVTAVTDGSCWMVGKGGAGREGEVSSYRARAHLGSARHAIRFGVVEAEQTRVAVALVRRRRLVERRVTSHPAPLLLVR